MNPGSAAIGGAAPGRVGVIGAGIAGLVTAKVLRDDGFDVIVFEKESAIGGVWVESRTYPGLRTNNSRDTYAFSDHPFDGSTDVFPTADQVRAYLASYVARFGLAPLIRLATEVVRVARENDRFAVETCGPTGSSTVECDFVVVCAGTFSEPDVPVIAGADRFEGTVVHSSQVSDPAVFAGRRVVVVGAGKSALDCATWAGSRAQSCTLVFRKPHWMLPRYFPGGIPSDRLIMTRLTEVFLRYHRLNRFEKFLHGPARTLTALVWRAVSALLPLLVRMPRPMVPDHLLPTGIENVAVGQEFYDMARRGELMLRRDAIAAFGGGPEIVLAGGDRIAADVIIFATGWRQPLSFLASDLAAAVVCDGRFQLYRHILPPTEQRLGFVGYASSTACQLTSEISAHWLSKHFRGELALPTVDDMQDEVRRVHAWLQQVLPARCQGYFVGPYLAHHIDDLMTDMGLPLRRTSNPIREYVAPLSPARYRVLGDQRRLARSGDTNRRRHHLRHARPTAGRTTTNEWVARAPFSIVRCMASNPAPTDPPPIAGVRRSFVVARGVRFHVTESGPEDGRSVVALHGWPQHHWVYRDLLADPPPGLRIIAPDLPGYGWSGPAPHRWAKEDVASDILALLDALGLDRVLLVGHDWGGYVGHLLVLRAPERVEGYLALNIAHPWLSPRALVPHLWRFLTYQPPLAAFGVPLQRHTRFIERLIYRIGATGKAIDPATARVYADRFRDPVCARAGRDTYRTFWLREIPAGARHPEARRATVPIRALFGIRDFAIQQSLAAAETANADDYTLEKVDCGHFIIDERPDLVRARLVELADETRSRKR